MSFTTLHIFEGTKKVAEISQDTEGMRLLSFHPNITEPTQIAVHGVLSKIQDYEEGADIPIQNHVRLIQSAFNEEGYRVRQDSELSVAEKSTLEKRESTPEMQREARFLHESNLIENIREISYEEILQRILDENETGVTGAWKMAKTYAKMKVPLKSSVVFEMHRLITEEQNQLGHTLSQVINGKRVNAPVQEKHIGALRDVVANIGGKTGIPAPTEKKFDDLLSHVETTIKEMKKYKNQTTQEDVLRFAAQHHLEFECMHPFADGNGRIGRILVNYILACFDISPLVFLANNKVAYYQGLIDYSNYSNNEDKNSSTMEEYFLSHFKNV